MSSTRRHMQSRRGPAPMRALVAAAFLAAAMPIGAAFAQEDAGRPAGPAISAEFPYEHRMVEVLGSRIAYVDEGEGDPILFIHGNPTSSYLWRNVMPYVEGQGRVIAVDLIGMGNSDKPDIGYTFQDHYAHVEGFVDALGLRNITFVIHDWGSALGLYYAAQHSDNVRAVAMMEAIVPPVFPIPSYDAMPEDFRALFQAFRDPVQGRELIVEQNFFVEQLLPQSVLRPLGEAEMAAYRAPFAEPASREPVFVWPNELPIGGEPARNLPVIEAIGGWLMTAEQPKLLLYASPGALTPPEVAAWMAENFANLETRFIGNAAHYIQEDQPEAIGRNLSDWLRDRVE